MRGGAWKLESREIIGTVFLCCAGTSRPHQPKIPNCIEEMANDFFLFLFFVFQVFFSRIFLIRLLSYWLLLLSFLRVFSSTVSRWALDGIPIFFPFFVIDLMSLKCWATRWLSAGWGLVGGMSALGLPVPWTAERSSTSFSSTSAPVLKHRGGPQSDANERSECQEIQAIQRRYLAAADGTLRWRRLQIGCADRKEREKKKKKRKESRI